MDIKFKISKATSEDINFIIESIIESDKSGSELSSFSTIFQLTEKEVRNVLSEMLRQEIDGCEFSLSSFYIARVSGEYAGTVAGWIEGHSCNNMSSYKIKAYLFGRCMPPKAIIAMKKVSALLSDLHIDRENGSYQIEYVYVSPAYRHQGIAIELLKFHEKLASSTGKMQVQLCPNNYPAYNTYLKFGFVEADLAKTYDERFETILPDDSRMLMIKNLEI